MAASRKEYDRMKKLNCLTAALLTVLTLWGCSAEPEPAPEPEPESAAVLPPTRIGENLGENITIDQLFSLESAFEEADLAALVRVGDWLAEDESGPYTLFSCQVLKIFKGEVAEDAGDEILLSQFGGTRGTVPGYPLFTAGNELLVFLKQIPSEEHNNGYWLLGSFTTFFDAVRDGNGDLYYLDRFGVLGDTVSGCENFLFDTDKAGELSRIAAEADPAAEAYRYHYIFSAAELDPVLEKLKTAE